MMAGSLLSHDSLCSSPSHRWRRMDQRKISTKQTRENKAETSSSPVQVNSWAKERGKNQELFLCMNLVKPRGDSWGQFHSPWSSQKPSPAWLVFFFPSSFPFYMFSSFCIQSFRERVEEREKERGKGWRNNRGRNAAAAARGEFTKAGWKAFGEE